MSRCFHCQECDLVWDSDFDFEDYGMDGEGIVHVLHCPECGSDVLYFVDMGQEQEAGRDDHHGQGW